MLSGAAGLRLPSWWLAVRFQCASCSGMQEQANADSVTHVHERVGGLTFDERKFSTYCMGGEPAGCCALLNVLATSGTLRVRPRAQGGAPGRAAPAEASARPGPLGGRADHGRGDQHAPGPVLRGRHGRTLPGRGHHHARPDHPADRHRGAHPRRLLRRCLHAATLVMVRRRADELAVSGLLLLLKPCGKVSRVSKTSEP